MVGAGFFEVESDPWGGSVSNGVALTAHFSDAGRGTAIALDGLQDPAVVTLLRAGPPPHRLSPALSPPHVSIPAMRCLLFREWSDTTAWHRTPQEHHCRLAPGAQG